ncbi:kinase-like domain-containing protein [Cyathus striatus]|nr:kinase-like domain-containing protein [Cyathus striatus]
MNHITPLPPSSFNFETRDRYSGTLQLRSKPGLSPGRYKLSPEAFYAQWPSHNLLQLTPSIHDFETRDYYSDYPDNPQSHATHSEDFEHDFCDEDNMMEKTDDINWHHGILCRGDLESRCFKSKEDICINNPYSDACGVLKAVCSNKVNYKKLLSLESSAAQLALDVMQMILDQSVTYSLGSAFEHILLKAMLRLSKRSTLYPRSYILTNVKRDEYPIASGHFGEVFRGDYNGRNVALKVFKLYANEMSRINDMLKAFFKEAILWRHLVHRNLLPFYGIYQLGDSGGRMCLVSPWMDNGNITQYLGRNPDVSRQHLTLDIARGIAYLHEKSIVHGDLKGVNVLISDNGVACLADFGLSSIINTYSLAWSSIESSVINAGTVRWQAPELLDEKSLGATKESDIYAFACVCYEVFVGKVPFYQCPFDPTVMRQIMLGQRPLRPELNSTPYIRWGLTQWMWSLIEECWREDASIRPQASEVVYKLSSRKEFLRGDAQNQDDSWGDLRPEVFRSLTDQRPSMSKEDVQCFMSLLKSL